nr:transposase [Yersinia frederiksenii]
MSPDATPSAKEQQQILISTEREQQQLIDIAKLKRQLAGSDKYNSMIKINKLKLIINSTSNSYDDACVENCFHSLEVELIHKERFSDR